MKNHQTITKIALTGFFSFALFFMTSGEAQAAVTSWYVNPQGNSCTPVPADYDQGTLPAGWTFIEHCGYSDGDGSNTCTYEICSQTYNDMYNYNGAVASFGASLNKDTYTPGEVGEAILFGSLDSYPGSTIANVLLFFTPALPGFRNLVCFFVGCPVTRQVTATMTVPYYNSTDIFDCTSATRTNPNDYGFAYPVINYQNPDNLQRCNYTIYDSGFNRDQKGGFYERIVFKAPITPGTYSANLIGCHEKQGCSVPAPLTFTVSQPPAPADIQIRFSKILNLVTRYLSL